MVFGYDTQLKSPKLLEQQTLVAPVYVALLYFELVANLPSEIIHIHPMPTVQSLYTLGTSIANGHLVTCKTGHRSYTGQ